MKVGGLLLAGGLSRRFGSEKAVAPLGSGLMMDVPLIVLRAICIELAVSVKAGSGAEAQAMSLSLNCLHDAATDAAGPLAGIRRGLSWAADAGFDWLAVAPCDVPTVTSTHYRTLIDAVEQGAPAAFGRSSSGPEPLASLWPIAHGRTMLDAAMEDGAHPAIRDVLAALGAVPVDLFGYDGRNVNTINDLPR